jgi:predicted RecB family nuclease
VGTDDKTMSLMLKEKYLDKKYEMMSWKEVAAAPASAISGVSEQDGKDLKEAFGINTVKELAKNKNILLAQGINAFSKASGAILDKTFESKEFEELRVKPVIAIAGISETDAQLLKQAFGVDTIQELAENKFVCIAQTIIALAFLEGLTSLM